MIRWGFLNTSKIAREKLLPAIKKANTAEIVAIGSSDIARAKTLANQFDIPKFYGSYHELLMDEDIDAVYISLPNHLHVEWTIKSLQAGKHVLCEKPIGLNEQDAIKLEKAAEAYPNLLVMEAFMYRFHPQWIYARDLVKKGELGTVKVIQSFFSYNNQDPNNIRNKVDIGGGGLMDIGCYCVSLSRHVFDEEPSSVVAQMQRHPDLKTDVITSGMLTFEKGISTFTCSTQLMPYQRVNIFGDKGRLEIEIPFNAIPDQQSRVKIYRPDGVEEKFFNPVDQYSLQFDSFSNSVLNNKPLEYSIKDAVANMRVIDKLFESSAKGGWMMI
ncbi:oxidoreductase domain protein [Pseudopedobacter saltans DSM 12145]|uniref:Oxidoreductase domain protein n=1 Tax=Pseudopedobacter saltans (strain ATCC 51119 / DSM 12145 / JCM 21818 / CCUG 39354 / LMG 10337 / NBRC 100064 / NCIMB 13643) TaxID=762903 RepID=F0SBR2_PSESL|nr:Gfo/Idh/MocA family oxidoreductase [Pseudopedobacter saltans]ADY52753.1 oxidoreductase domain protein [Pseudopedobacter saltans DSM 12145]